MRFISNDDIKNLNLSNAIFYDWVEQALISKKEALLPAKISLKPEHEVFYNTMPCIIKSEKVAGVKVVNRYPQNTPSLTSHMMIYDLDNGSLKAIFEADYITTMRTGAVAAHSINTFAKKGYSTLACIGLGNVVKATIMVLAEKFSNKNFIIKLFKYKDQHTKLSSELPYKNIKYVYVDNIEELVKGSDVVISGITYTDNDIASPDLFDNGALLVPIHTRGFMQCDLVFDKVFADDLDHVKGFKYFDNFKYFSEVSDVLIGQNKGRENDNERIICYNIGIALHDVYFANRILNLLKS